MKRKGHSPLHFNESINYQKQSLKIIISRPIIKRGAALTCIYSFTHTSSGCLVNLTEVLIISIFTCNKIYNPFYVDS